MFDVSIDLEFVIPCEACVMINVICEAHEKADVLCTYADDDNHNNNNNNINNRRRDNDSLDSEDERRRESEHREVYLRLKEFIHHGHFTFKYC